MKSKILSFSKSRKNRTGGYAREPTFTVRLSFVANQQVSLSNNVVFAITYHNMVGFAPLSSFFQFAHPLSYSIDVMDSTAASPSWNGLATFVPTNWELDNTVPTSFIPSALAETPDCIYVQTGQRNRSLTKKFQFTKQGWNAQVLDGNGTPANSKILGYLIFYNENPSVLAAWSITSVFHVTFKFWKRNVIQYGSLTSGAIPIKLDVKKDPPDEDDAASGSVSIMVGQ